MIAAYPIEARDFTQFRFQLERIRSECPEVVKWLEQSVEETTDAVCVTKDGALVRNTGALNDLRTILRAIRNPPAAPVTGDKPKRMNGMGAV